MTREEHDKRVDYVEFAAPDLDLVKTFYAAVFGWSFTDYGPDYAAFNDGRLDGGFFKSPEVARAGALVVMYATDIESIEQAVRQNGGTIVKDIFSFPGGRRFHFADPAGNVLAVWSDR